MSKLCIINTIKTKIKGNATSYVERENEIFIPKSDRFTLEQTYKIAVKKVDKINQEYLSEKFGKVVSLNTSASNGTGIKIHPSQLLIEAYEVKEGNKSIEEINRLDFFNGDVALYEQELKDFENEANLMRFSDLRQELRVQEGKLNFKNGKISDFEILSENSVINREISQKQAQTIFNKKNKTIQDKKDLSIYFANYFLNSVYDKEGLLYLGYTRFLRYGIATPKLLVVKDNGRKNPFFQYNNTVVIGLKQIEKFIDNLKTPTFDKFENLINVVAQEEIIHLYADYLLNSMDIDNIYNEMTEKDISQIKRIYGNSSIQKENIVHEYVRMVVQQKVFGRTTEYESFTLSNALMSMFERLLEELNDFLSTIIGSTNTKKAIEDVINFTKGNFSEELDKKIIARVFEKGQILESNLENLNEQLPNQLKTFIDESNKIGEQIRDVQNIQFSLSPEINYQLKAIEILNSQKGKQVFEKGQKNNWSLDKILTELQIPKEQKQIILDKGFKVLTNNDARIEGTTEQTLREEIITSLLAENSFVVEINTAKKGDKNTTDGTNFYVNGVRYVDQYGSFYKIEENGDPVKITTEEFKQATQIDGENTQHYSNLTVPGGTNGSYIEANIETPMIIPSIQSHAEFKTENTIGWMRADEKQNYQEKDIDNLIEIMKKSGILGVNCG